jgi:hypothetical protein
MVKSHTLYVKICDVGSQAIDISTSFQSRGLHIPQQSAATHSYAMRFDGALQETLSPRPSNREPQVRVGGKPARPYLPRAKA